MLTGKPLDFWGSKIRTEATGYGLVYYVKHLLNEEKDSFNQKIVFVSGSGNVAIYAIEKVQELGGKVVTCSDSNGYIYDPEGIDVKLLKEVKEINRQRLTEYANQRPSAVYHAGESVWGVADSHGITMAQLIEWNNIKNNFIYPGQTLIVAK
ncbi:LysM peptidoglycan-binding domain-containing protein [Enterococcus faecium]|uniref:LysM peptidoglycan-binding domain-containing protein n=1 Tax=Enterococcus faecium TaxID=1352 RepID=UPI00387E5FFE